MGADFLAVGLRIPLGREPDWDAGAAWIESIGDLSNEELDTIAEGPGWDLDLALENDLDVHDLQERLRRLLGQLREELEAERNHEIDWFVIAGHRLYLTGGLSSGDSPTDSFDVFSDAISTGLAMECGFMESPVPVESIRAVVDYSWDAERRDFEEEVRIGEIEAEFDLDAEPNGAEHAFVHLNRVRRWLNDITAIAVAGDGSA